MAVPALDRCLTAGGGAISFRQEGRRYPETKGRTRRLITAFR
jgi:hypothetical protein